MLETDNNVAHILNSVNPIFFDFQAWWAGELCTGERSSLSLLNCLSLCKRPTSFGLMLERLAADGV